MLATTPTLTEAPDTESMRTLTTCLPEELLSRLLGFVPESAFTAQFTHELAVRLPALAAVCVTFRRALLASSKIALRFSGLRPAPHDWDHIIRVITKRRKLRPDVLLLDDCNIKPATLAGLLHAQPLSVVSIRRCHSLQGETLNSLPDDRCGATILLVAVD